MNRAALDWARRWRGPLTGAALAAGALALFLRPALEGAWLAWGLLAVGLAGAAFAASDGLRRARLGLGARGPGIVAVREGRVAYFGPFGGGVADLDALTRVTLARGPHGALWLLFGAAEGPLRVPATADGAEALLDALAALPGFDAGRVDRALAAGVETEVWRRGAPVPAARLTGV